MTGTIRVKGEGHLRLRHRRHRRPAPDRDGVPEVEPLPEVRSTTTWSTACASRGSATGARLDEACERSLRGAALWDEVKDRLADSALGLSGGQQQRVCIARAIAVEPEILLMDEPCSALDPIATLKIEELIYELKEKYTIVIVTHNLQQAARVSDKTAFFWLGRLVEFGPTAEMFTAPKDKLHRRLHHGPVRIDRDGGPGNGTAPLRSRAAGAPEPAPHHGGAGGGARPPRGPGPHPPAGGGGAAGSSPPTRRSTTSRSRSTTAA